MSEVRDLALAAQQASHRLGGASLDQRNDALHAMAAALREQTDTICAANKRDMDAARKAGTSASLLDRLMLDSDRIEGMAHGLEDLAELPDPLGRVLDDRTFPNGLKVQKVSVALGVVAMVYEARPNVTSDAAGICIKSGNAVVLRGGSLAFESNTVIAHVLDRACGTVGLPEHCVCIVATRDRSAADELLHLRGIIDVLIPRGGAGLIKHCVQDATVPVIETGVGNCHIYVHDPADFAMALSIILNAKCQRPGVCNAAESLLVDASIAQSFLAELLPALHRADVVVHGDEAVVEAGKACGVDVVPAIEEDWGREYLALEMSVHVVSGLDEAVSHIARYGTGHSECIVTQDDAAAEEFLSRVDAAAVYVNASTRFTDGGQFGLGAEIGISTQKLHVRGPFALDALTTTKYLVRGSGQVRS